MDRNIALYPWFKFFQNLLFWQSVWFLYIQSELSASEAILIFALAEVTTTVLEVPSGYASDRLGRKGTLLIAALCGVIAAALQINAQSFEVFALAQLFLGASFALASGTDTALLYEALKAEGRTDETEAQELKAWRFTFAALALSAVLGGLFAVYSFSMVYALTAAAFGMSAVIAIGFKDPPNEGRSIPSSHHIPEIRQALRKPVLIWLFVLFVLAHIYGHLPFVFGPPFILEALGQIGWSASAPLVAGGVATLMMLMSLLASLVAPALRQRYGLATILPVAFAAQIAICVGLAASGSLWIIAVLLVRMVPSPFIAPFITARIQPELPDAVRATFMSLKSFVARLLFAGSLAIASIRAGDTSQMALNDIQAVMWPYVIFGLICLIVLVLTRHRAQVDT